MKTRSCFILMGRAVLALALSFCPLITVQAVAAETASASALENSVVKVFSTLRGPDPYKPWSKAGPQEVTGSGVVIDGHRILTNAHVVGYASQVQIQANGAGDKIPATVLAISRGMDLALLKIDDDSFFDSHKPVPRANVLPDVRDAVLAYGYPTGGTSLSITKGIVSRIEFVRYNYPVSGLRIQIDAAINPGNSGGPVIAGDKMIGLAFAGALNMQNIGYIIPNEEIDLFLRDEASGTPHGKPAMFDTIQTLENPALRTFLKLGKNVEGAVVLAPFSKEADYPLKELDVITHIGDFPIDNQGMVKLNANSRVRFQYRVQQLAKNGLLPLTVVRNGASMKVSLPVSSSHPMLIPSLAGNYPSYFIFGPMVFSRATSEFMNVPNGNPQILYGMAFAGNPLMTRRGDKPDAQREELVVIASPFFPHKLMNGYSTRFFSVLYSVNGVPVRSLAHLVTLLRDQTDDLLTFRFEQRDAEAIVVPRKEMLAATESILTDNGIRSEASPDMLKIWNEKTPAGK
ncbi:MULTISPECIES: S1C family serine protease [unclassified Janthinobacterium]|uniref:S1C family serine protease n=1 Tax=unclassified Janthinobacterium TaxID=2610881 RepID=UPI00182B30C9|nr:MULTISPECIES: S1C family serine protease [unclassified Janthinobacterium]MBB5368043.1 S1-C subfamily serine protease [Janthinobacterium sp. K2C7]MBB5379479.1 S1-C subfamily serine protease [Janthinobacterium sp. K2Li3]MBB5386425.1 S1-C subfamily serine protease [Janthinobacterium sp. K2E3]